MLRTAIPRLVCSSATKSPLAQNQLHQLNTPLRRQNERCLCHPFRHLNDTARRLASKYITPKVERRLEDISTRYSLVVEELVNDAATLSTERRTTLSRELSALEDASEASKEYRKVKRSLAEVEDLIADPNTDSELRQMAKDERREILDGMPAVEEKIINALLPREPEDVGSAIMEIRAGAGGDEAALFAADMLRMYERFAFLQGWKFDIMTVSAGPEAGSNTGFKEAIVSIAGADVFGLLKFESGVHRVQRVPATETQGRVHTSTAQVALLPQMSENQVKINPSDLRIDVYRSSGAGGQHVNKTESAVRITHYPTGVVVAIQDERSQHRNKEKAMSILYARVAELDRVQRRDERSRQRQSLIGKGERSEKIRTYNFAQNRVTDHRIGLTMHGLDRFLMGETLLDVINALKIQAKVEAMTEITQD